MKHLYKYIFILTLTIISSKEIYGQMIGGGVIAGVNFAQIDGDGAAGYNKFGWNLGLTGMVPIHEKMSINTEICYNQRGTNTVIPGIGNQTFSYIDAIAYYNYKDAVKYNFGTGIAYGQQFSTNAFGSFSTLHETDLGWIINFYTPLKNRMNFNFRYTRSIFSLGQGASAKGIPMGVYHNFISIRFLYLIKRPGI
jgi:hypothetical protein